MQMVLIAFRSSLEGDVLGALEDVGVGAFTVLPHALGVGEAGRALHAFPWPGFNSVILAAVGEPQALRLVERLVALHDRSAARQGGARIPLRVFTLPCVQAI
jgi:hypothetical protein